MYWSPNFLAKQEILQQVVTRMQDLAFEFSKIFRGWYPGPSQPEGRPAPARPGAGRKRPGVEDTLVPSTFQPWLRPWSGTIFLDHYHYFTQPPPHWLLVWRSIVSKSTIYLY